MITDLYRQWMLRLQAFLAGPVRPASTARSARR